MPVQVVVEVSKMRAGGLRYISKPSGSHFGTGSEATLSCIKCGIHRPKSSLRPFKLAGNQHYCCAPQCAS